MKVYKNNLNETELVTKKYQKHAFLQSFLTFKSNLINIHPSYVNKQLPKLQCGEILKSTNESN